MQLAPRSRSRLGRHRATPPRRRGSRLQPARHAAGPALDPLFLLAILLLGALGLLNLVALKDTSMALHQGLSLAVGLGIMVWAWRRRTNDWRWLGWLVYLTSVLLLLGVAVIGAHAYGAQRWLALGSLVFQPSELAELGLVLVLAQIMTNRELSELRRVGLALGLGAVPIALTLLEPDLSTAGLLGVILVAALVLGRVRIRVLAVLFGAAAVILPLGIHLLRPYQLARLQGFLGGGSSGGAASYTLLQSHIAIASGGLLGAGHSTLARLLTTYLPARETDLAFSSLVEQLGIVAGAAAIGAVVVLVWRLVSATSRSRTPEGALIAGTLAILVGTESALSVAGNLGLLPLAGVPIPLLSYGGTATIAHLAAFGVVMGLRRDSTQRSLWKSGPGLVSRPRLARVGAATLVLSLLLLAGLTYRLQRLDGESLHQAALTEVTRSISLPPVRGTIEDRHGVVLAESVPSDQAEAIPSLIASDHADLRILSRKLGESLSTLRRQLGVKPTGGGYTVTVGGQLTLGQGSALKAANLPGVVVVRSNRRVYPYGDSLGPILGYTGVETPAQVKQLGLLPPGATLGQAGLEEEYDKELRGSYGSQSVLVTPQGSPVALGQTKAPVNGGKVVTTLDLPLQQYVTQQLQKAISGAFAGSQPGDEGAAVVMYPQNGQILAMASLPGYNDNLFGPPIDQAALAAEESAAGDPMLEHATQLATPPGSTFKLVVASADAQYQTVPPNEVIPTGGSWTYDGWTYASWADLPPQNLPQSIAWSNDVYFYKLAVALGDQDIINTAHELGVGEGTGIDLPGEYPGYIGTPQSITKLGDTWVPGDTVAMGIGQGYVTATPLQIARWTAAVGTGKLVTPRLGLLKSSSATSPLSPVSDPAPKALSFASDLGALQQGLRLAVTQGTAGELSALDDAGGKTGTAQDPTAPNGGPDALFAALAPMSDPQIAVTLVVRGGGEGFYSSQPAVKNIMQYFQDNQQQILSSISPAPQPSTSPGTPSPSGAASAAAPSPATAVPAARISSEPGAH